MVERELTRRQILIGLGIGVTMPLVGCGGGSSASTPPPSPSPTPLDITPTVTFDGTASTGLTTEHAYLTASSTLNPAFTFSGASLAAITQFGTTYPRQNMVSSDLANTDTSSAGSLYSTFYHTGKTLDVIQYGFSDGVTLYINDVFTARYGLASASGTAQGGSASGITLDANSSVVSGYYNEYYVRIAGGTGVLNEVRQITAYDGTTFIATVASAWTTTPDSTTLYVIQEGTQPFVLDGPTGSIKYLHLKWNVSGQRKITIEQGIFVGVESDGTIAAAPTAATTPLLAVGDSFWEGDAAPINIPRLLDTFASSMNWLPTGLGQGGTGYITPYTNRLNFQDRIAPPNEAWRVSHTATGGTFTITVNYGGAADTTAALAYSASQLQIKAALNALANVVGAGASFAVARGDIGTPLIIVAHGMPGATITFDNSTATGGTFGVIGTYVGDVATNVPKDASGAPTSFYLLVPGSGNDSTFTDAEVQAAATYVAQQIVARFPTAIPIFTGVFGDCSAGDSVIGAADISRNAALAAAAAYLPKIGGKVPFIDTYQAGLGGLKIINGLGTVADPQAGTNSNYKSITEPGHPTGPGSQFLSDWLVPQVKALIA